MAAVERAAGAMGATRRPGDTVYDVAARACQLSREQLDRAMALLQQGYSPDEAKRTVRK